MGQQLTVEGDTKRYRGDLTIADLKLKEGIPADVTLKYDDGTDDPDMILSDRDRLKDLPKNGIISRVVSDGVLDG